MEKEQETWSPNDVKTVLIAISLIINILIFYFLMKDIQTAISEKKSYQIG